MRGLKRAPIGDRKGDVVAPHTGAWIETDGGNSNQAELPVAPHTGAWIETSGFDIIIVLTMSHPTRVRGLKLAYAMRPMTGASRTPHGCVD